VIPMSHALQTRAVRCYSSFPSVDTPVPPVFDGIVAATPQAAGNISPSLPDFVDQLLDEFTFTRGDGVMIQRRLQVLVIPLATLFRRSVLHVLRDANPVVRALAVHKLEESSIFLRQPRTSSSRACHDIRA
jgi:hypothetical protein